MKAAGFGSLFYFYCPTMRKEDGQTVDSDGMQEWGKERGSP